MGNSAWLYGKEELWIKQISDYNKKQSPSCKINYLFPETGIIPIDSKHNKLIMTYDPGVTKFYKEKLKNIKIIPDLSFWVAQTNFKHWSVAG